MKSSPAAACTVITGLTDTVVTLEIADNIRVKVSRQYILSSASTASAKDQAGSSSS